MHTEAAPARLMGGDYRRRSVRTIVHVITRFVRGGADENTLLSCNAQAAAGHEVVLVFGGDNSAEMRARLDPRVRQICLPTLMRQIDPVRDTQALIALISLIGELKPQIVHTHTSKAGILGRLAGYLAGADAVVHGVHILPFVKVGPVARAAYLALERLLDPLTDAFVSVSGDLRDTCLTEQVGAPPAHAVIPSGMETERFRRATPVSRAEVEQAFGWSHKSPPQLVVMAAALEPRKRVVEFLHAFKRVVEREPNAVLAILGEGVERLRALDQIDAIGLAGNVRLLGFRDDVERWIAAAQVCVLASEREGLPRAVVQYVLAARPVVVSALPGIDAVVAHGQNGFITDGDDLDEMAAPIFRLLVEPALARAFAEHSRRLNLSAWSVENMTAELEHVYERALDGPREQRTGYGEAVWIS
jgi:glycosyltransferase involved in cell wall biosynthesis